MTTEENSSPTRPNSLNDENAVTSFMVILSHHFLFQNKPRSHYQIIYTISLPWHNQLKGAKGFFLRSRLTDLPLICATAPQSLITTASKPLATKLREMYRLTLHCCQTAVCHVSYEQNEPQTGLNVVALRLEVTVGERRPR